MFVLISTGTTYCGHDNEDVYEFSDDTTDNELLVYAADLAWDYAVAYGAEEQAEEEGVELDVYSNYIILNGTREAISYAYGEILQA